MTQARRPPPIRGSIGPEDHWFTTQRKQVALTNSIGTDWPVRLLARSARQRPPSTAITASWWNQDCTRQRMLITLDMQPALKSESSVPYTLTLAGSVGLRHPQVDNTH